MVLGTIIETWTRRSPLKKITSFSRFSENFACMNFPPYLAQICESSQVNSLGQLRQQFYTTLKDNHI